MGKVRRIRDPVHGLITFDVDGNEVDRVAWQLIDTPEFQRLRRIKQLGLSEFTFPGATHSRFAHSIGVFHVARQLMEISVPEKGGAGQRRRTALIAALLHDVGHGPLSHAFEAAEKVRLGERYQEHEHWSARIIAAREGAIRRVLKEAFQGDGAIADDIAQLLTSDPADIYAAVVSSSFDADRLDYLRRDRMMTGSGAGAIDFDWLMDNLRVVEVPAPGEGPEEEAAGLIQTFAFEEKAIQAVEAFILARYHLYWQVYLHRTTRGVEQLLAAFLSAFAAEAVKGRRAALPVDRRHPLRAYYAAKVPTLELYLALDDAIVWSAVEACATHGTDLMRDLAQRILSRRIMRGITIDMADPTPDDIARRRVLDEGYKDAIGKTIFMDRASLSIYTDPQRETVPPHKRVYIRRYDGSVDDVTRWSKPIKALSEGAAILRYYFVDDSIRKTILSTTGGRHDRA